MAGIGVRLNRIFEKQTITTHLVGFFYSIVITVAPMLAVIITVLLMQQLLGFTKLDYARRELFSCTLLYTFVFSLLTASPFNAVLSRYMSDTIYEERFEDIVPCYYVGLLLNVGFSCVIGIPFCVWEYVVGGVDILFVFAGYCGYMSLTLVFYSMLYLSICKDYKKISLFFGIGMIFTILLSVIFVYGFQMDIIYAMLIAMDAGFVLIGVLEFAQFKGYFRENSGKYKAVLQYFKKYWKLVVANFLYSVGLYVHNFVFWSTDMKMVVADSFVCMPNYDMASCIAMFTNISASVIFISRVEMNFHDRYKAYSEAVIGGRGIDIENTKKRMFTQLTEELMSLVRIQFIVSILLFFVCIIVLPRFGLGGNVMKIYPCLAAGYFILFVMYAAIIFQYYYNDLDGAVWTSLCFVTVTYLGSILSSRLPTIWYGLGLVMGAYAGWSVAYYRLRRIEKHLDIHIFCEGNIMKRGVGKRPSNRVYVKQSILEQEKVKKRRR
ncbi:MAG: exopolysaccharide Pel transporter PelG [Lachnospiraceae bacterium]|nr:exopolysaccharide Pel transporter PelG [Lachnospiraceae bacterium]